MGDVNVRVYRAADHDNLIKLWHRCDLVSDANDPSRDIARKTGHDPEGIAVAVADDAMVGSVMLGYEGHRGWINYLAVDPNWRRLGIGRQLMNFAERRLESQGCPKINLQVRASNQDVVSFYAALGYGVEDRISLGKRIAWDDS